MKSQDLISEVKEKRQKKTEKTIEYRNQAIFSEQPVRGGCKLLALLAFTMHQNIKSRKPSRI